MADLRVGIPFITALLNVLVSFHCSVMRFDQSTLAFKALLVVYEVTHGASKGPVAITLGLRLALAYLYATGKNQDVDMFKRFAACLTDQHRGQTEYMGNYLRSTAARGYLCGFMENAGVDPNIDNQRQLRETSARLNGVEPRKPTI